MHSLSFVNTGLSVWTSVELTSLSPPNLEAFSEQLDCLGKLSGVVRNCICLYIYCTCCCVCLCFAVLLSPDDVVTKSQWSHYIC